MNLYPEDTLEKFQFDKIVKRLSQFCHSPEAVNRALELEPSMDKNYVELMSIQTYELFSIYERQLNFPSISFPSIGKEIDQLKVDGMVLEESQFVRILRLSQFSIGMMEFLKNRTQVLPALNELTGEWKVDKELVNEINRVIDESGIVKSSASKKLADIRRDIQSKRQRVAHVFDNELRKYKELGWLADFGEGVSNDRRVLAVLAEHKRKIPGIIHGSSETGKTAFIEHGKTVEINNELAELIHDEKRELYKILKELTFQVAKHIDYLSFLFEFAIEMDLISSKAELGRLMNGIVPEIREDNSYVLDKALHPVLLLQYLNEEREIVPLSLDLHEDQRIIIISGPNAGGKSIALKTLGLFQIMFQSGLMVPSESKTSLPVIEKLFVDIGDDQSIEAELSTYSSRLTKMKYFLEHLDKDSLFLIDEFGTGSDPELGGAMAEAILEEINKVSCKGIVTTHYSNIKVLAEVTEGIQNASMLFEKNTLQPLYQLSVGQPGSSFTFEVANKIGLPKEIIIRSKQKVNSSKVQLDKLISSLQNEKTIIRNERNRLKSEKKEALRMQKVFDKLLKDLKDRQKDDVANMEENLRLINYGMRVDRWIQSWLEKKNRPAVVTRIKQYLNGEIAKKIEKENEKKLELAKKKLKKKKKRPPTEREQKFEVINVGDQVVIRGSKQKGIVEIIKDDKASVQFDLLKMTIDVAKLKKVQINTKKS